MTPDDFNVFRTQLIAAMDEYVADGGTIISGRFGGYDDASCPLTCLLQPWPSDGESAMVNEKLTQHFGFVVSDEEVWDFIFNFDGSGRKDTPSRMAILGRELRDKYITKGE